MNPHKLMSLMVIIYQTFLKDLLEAAVADSENKIDDVLFAMIDSVFSID